MTSFKWNLMDFRNLFPSYWDLEKWTLEIKILNNVVSDTNIQSSSKGENGQISLSKKQYSILPHFPN